MPGLPSWLPNTQNALRSKTSNLIGGAIGKINNPLLRGAAGQLLDGIFPGLGGGTPDYTDNVFRRSAKARMEKVIAATELASTVQVKSQASDMMSQTFDWRARLRPKNGGADRFYSKVGNEANFLLKPLKEAGGLVWQYTPNIFLSGSAEYNEALMQGMNYPINTFISSRPPDIPITADFSANDQYEARYLLAVMTFLKICTKGYFGDDAVNKGTAGTPPPVLLFEYLGDHGFNKVPVVVSNYSIQLPDNVDYVPVQVAGDTLTYVPTMTNIMITLKPQYTPHKLRKNFSLEQLTSGAAYKQGFM